MKYEMQFVGGKYATETDYSKMVKLADGFTEDLSVIRSNGGWVHRAELDNQPTFNGYAGPMWNGINSNGNAVLRYETWDAYNLLSD